MGWKRNSFELLVRAAAAIGPRCSEPPKAPESIFVLRNNDLGDLLVVTPLFEALRRRFPQARIIAGVGAWAAPILAGNPYVDEVLPINAPWHNQQVQPQGLRAAFRYLGQSPEVAELKARHCTIGIDVLGSGLGSLLLLRAGIPWRLGVEGYAGGESAAQQSIRFDAQDHVGRSALRFAELLGATDLPENRPQLFFDSPIAPGRTVVVAPGGGFVEKCWPLAHFAAVIDQLAAQRVIVIGGPCDREAGSTLAADRPWVEDRTGRQSLRESFRTIGAAALVLTNSSMAMHAAAAFRRPCLTLLGAHFSDAPQHAAQWGYPETRVLGREREHPEIWTPDEVWPVIRELLPPS